jgi:hypothetical protein
LSPARLPIPPLWRTGQQSSNWGRIVYRPTPSLDKSNAGFSNQILPPIRSRKKRDDYLRNWIRFGRGFWSAWIVSKECGMDVLLETWWWDVPWSSLGLGFLRHTNDIKLKDKCVPIEVTQTKPIPNGLLRLSRFCQSKRTARKSSLPLARVLH